MNVDFVVLGAPVGHPFYGPPAQSIDPAALGLLEDELHRMGVRTLGGFTLPLEPEHGARLLVAALRLLGGRHVGSIDRGGDR